MRAVTRTTRSFFLRLGSAGHACLLQHCAGTGGRRSWSREDAGHSYAGSKLNWWRAVGLSGCALAGSAMCALRQDGGSRYGFLCTHS